MSETGRILGYIGLGTAGVLLGLALTLVAVQFAQHLAWRVERRRNRRCGDLYAALARRRS